MYKIIYGVIEFEIKGTYRHWFRDKEFVGVKQVYIEPTLIKIEKYEKCIENLYNNIRDDIESSLKHHYLHSYEYESYGKIYNTILDWDYIKLKTPVDIKEVTDVTVEKIRELANIEQYVEIENYYKNKLLAKENISAK